MYLHALNCGLRIRADFAAKQHISVTQAAKFLPFKETASRHVKFRKKKKIVKMILHLSVAATRSNISVANFLFSEFDSKAQCGNFMIFLSLRFYVKSILEILEVKNLQI